DHHRALLATGEMPSRFLDDRRWRLGALERRQEALLPRALAGALVELGGHDDRAALAHDRRGREAQIGRGARGLIEVHVLWLADARDRDVVLLRDRARVQLLPDGDERAQHVVGRTRLDGDDALAIVRDHVDAEPQARAPSDLGDRLVEWIAVDLGEPHAGI